jgi:Protein of unknown function (DUF1326)
VGDLSFRVRGAYFESCNCDAICPCRMIGGVPGGRSTHGICFGVLSWQIADGFLDDVDLGGLNVALVCRYDDDEPGSPWSIVLHVDELGDERQRTALEHIFLTGIPHLPWIRKARHLIGVRTSKIEIDGTHLRVGSEISLHATRRVETNLPVACGIPGYDRSGYELYADELRVDDDPFAWELSGNCAFAGDFDYASPSSA